MFWEQRSTLCLWWAPWRWGWLEESRTVTSQRRSLCYPENSKNRNWISDPWKFLLLMKTSSYGIFKTIKRNQQVTHWPLQSWIMVVNFKLISRIDIKHLLWNCCKNDATRPHWWLVNIVSGNGLVPSGNKPLPGPILTPARSVLPHGITRPQWVNIRPTGALAFLIAPDCQHMALGWHFLYRLPVYREPGALIISIFKDPKQILKCPFIEIHYKFSNLMGLHLVCK